jgi:hypothetical protein
MGTPTHQVILFYDGSLLNAFVVTFYFYFYPLFKYYVSYVFLFIFIVNTKASQEQHKIIMNCIKHNIIKLFHMEYIKNINKKT